jgi:nucleoside-diphosphate-sugar epimerase
MKVFVAGSTGTIGVPLVRALVAGGHRVYGLTRRPSNGPLLTSLGAEAVVADAMDRGALLAAVDRLTADAVIHQLTALKRPPARATATWPRPTPCALAARPTCWRRPGRSAPTASSPSR